MRPYFKPQNQKTMKKIFAMLAIAGIMVSCGGKKKADTPTEGKDTAATTTTTTTTEVAPSSSETTSSGVPTFSDPEVQKFANDYNAFIQEYKAGMNDPAKLAELGKSMQDWSKRAQEIGMKLASKPEEAKAWADWAMKLSQELMPK